MAIDEERRFRLYEAVRQVFGDPEAATLMEYLPPVGWADVATKHDLLELESRLDLRFDALRADLLREISSVEAGARVEIAGARVEIAGVRGEVAGLRAELHKEIGTLHDALREQTTRLMTWTIATWISAVGIAVAAARLR
jgi:hypothetical protein